VWNTLADAKIEIKVGTVSFSGEGTGDWLSKQLDKVLEKLPELAKISAPNENEKIDDSKASEKHPTDHCTEADVTLASFLKDKKATTNQNRKFLATALWLEETKGLKRLNTGNVTTALNDHNQGKLGNASQCLASNAASGWVVRDGKQFYVSDEGRTELGK
jgi:hypothetical protein